MLAAQPHAGAIRPRRHHLSPEKISGSPFFVLPTTTTLAFWLLASSIVASMPFHSSSLSLMPSADDVLEVLDAVRLDPLALGFLLLALQHELHPLRFLLRLLFRLDSVLQRVGELQVAQQDVLDDDAARLHLAPAGPRRICCAMASRASE